MRSNKGDGSIYFKFSIPENSTVPFSFDILSKVKDKDLTPSL